MVITAHNLHFQWRSQGPEILHIPQLAIEAGERVLIRGASGSGKSTLLSLLAGITVPTRGSIRVLGQSLETLDGAQRDHFRADHIGYLFQLFNLLPCPPPRPNNLRISATMSLISLPCPPVSSLPRSPPNSKSPAVSTEPS